MLIVGLDPSKKEPLYEQIYTCIKEEIRTGALPFGSKLPSARRMAKHLDVSRNTVDLAYGQLVAEGYIESKPKRGFYVCQVEELAALNIPIKKEEEETEVKEEIIPFDFSPNGVDMTQFPYHIWRKILKEIMIDDNSELFQKGNYQGDLELRRAIMYY
ncbi:MAG: GntR family transcriptional regulator, partial [Anaerostipes faecalis]|nr:GntR family transcriptional regulator [Anaerostipes faecalis]